MKKYLRIAQVCFLIAAIGIYLLIQGCATVRDEVPTWCVPSSIFCATAFVIKTNCPTRIAIFRIKPGLDHAQAQAFIDGEWKYISEYWNGECMAVKVSGKNCPDTQNIEPYIYYTVTGFLEQQREALGVGL